MIFKHRACSTISSFFADQKSLTSLIALFHIRVVPFKESGPIQSVLGAIAATSSFEPDPHWETDLIACVNGTFKGCTRSRLRI